MRAFSKGRLARAIARVLTLTFIWSMWLTGVAVAPAAGQIATRAATTQSVAVVPFDNLTGILPEVLGDEASEAISVELRDRLLLDVLPKADVTLQMRDIGLFAPLSDVELVRLASELEIALLVAGQVRAAHILRSPEGRYAEVVLAVRLFDRVARADVNGALVTARGPASLDASDEVLLRKALGQAAFQAVEEMRSRPTITAMVLWSRGETVFLNVGTRGGVRPGMTLVAIRGGERIGLVKVSEADATGSYADVVEGSSLRTGDHLRAVYELPTAVGARPARMIERTGKRFEKVLIAAAMLFGLGGIGSRARLLTEGGIAAPFFTTSNLANADELNRGGYFWSLLFDVMIPIGATLTTWEPYSGTQKRRIFVYEIWRNEQFVAPLYIPEHAQNYYIDAAESPGFRSIEWTIDVTTGELSETEWTWDPYEPEFDDETGEWDPESWTDFADGHADDTYIDISADYAYYGWLTGPDITGPGSGQFYVYRVRPIVLVQAPLAAGQYEWHLTEETEFSSTQNQVIPVSAPGAYPWYWVFQGYEQGVYEVWDVFDNPYIVANLATFHFYSPFGADEMIVQVTRDPNITFDPAGVYSQSIAVSYGYATEVEVDLTQVPGTGDIFWWRIGARNRRSVVRPRPWPLNLTNDYGWVWSNRLSFSLIGMSRASLLHEEREALARSQVRAMRLPRRAAGERVHRAE